MRRFLALAVLFAFSLPVGLSVVGCGPNPGDYCIKNGHAYGIKTTQVTNILLQPETTGVSLSWGQTYQAGPASAYNCLGGSESVGHYTYTSSNLSLADISPAGTICAGTWNRNSPGNVPNFTICTPPAGSSENNFSGCTSGTCGIVQVTAQGAGATSNPVDVYIHPPVTSVTIPSQTACIPQGQALGTSLLHETAVRGPGGALLCCPPGTTLADGTACPATATACDSPAADMGTIAYSPVTTSVVTINNTTNPASAAPGTTTTTTTTSNPNGTATANLPGSTVINANLSNSDVTSAAGFFSTCPPANIKLSVDGGTSATVTPSSPQTVQAIATDSLGNTINGLSLNFASTEPENLSVGGAGLVTSTFPSHATVTAVCTPPACNPAPVNLIGTLGNGMPVAANPVTIDSPGRVTNEIWMASSQSPYFSEVNLLTGGQAAPIRLPFTPNSMVIDQAGDTLYFGSYHELMIYTAANNSLSSEVPSLPGVVLAVAPDNSTVVVNDQLRGVIYVATRGGVITSSIAGIANHAQFTPDGSTVYMTGVNPATGQNTLFVYNTNTGWSTYPLTNQPAYSCALDAAGTTAVPAYNPAYDPFCGDSVAITVPHVAAFLAGTSTTANSFCPNASATPPFYPPAYPPGGDVPAATTQLAATSDGNHILGADDTTFTDIWMTHQVSGTTVAGVPTGACPAYTSAALTLTTPFNQTALPVTASEIDQVVSSPYSNLAFVMYQGTGATGVLPYYTPSSTVGSAGAMNTFQLATGAQSPVAGIFAPDGSIFFVSTSGDDLVHMLSTTTTTPTETGTIDPKLTGLNGQPVPPQFLAVRSIPTT